MNMPPITKELIEARQRDMRAAADGARLARAAKQAKRQARAAARVPRPVRARRWRRFGLAWLFGTD
jgi:hypothetical protein